MTAAPISKPQPGRMPAKERQQQIVEIAAELFSKNGFRGTKTKDIAERAGVSEAIIFRHFASKEDLYSAILDSKLRQSNEVLATHLKEAARRQDDNAFFTSLAFDLLELHRHDPGLMRLLMFSGLEGHELSEIFFHSTVSEARNLLHSYIKERVAAGAFRTLDVEATARAFVGMVIYQVFLRTLYKIGNAKESSQQLAQKLADLFLTGVKSGEFRVPSEE